MSFTITSPSILSRVVSNNTNIFVINSTNFAQTNFRFIIKVQKLNLSDNNYTTLITLTKTPDQSGNTYLDISSILEKQIQGDISINSTGNYECINGQIRYFIYAEEWYGSPVIYHGSAVSSNCVEYNGIETFQTYDYELGNTYWLMKYDIGDTVRGHFLNECNEYWIDSTEKMFLYFLADPDNRPGYIKFTFSSTETLYKAITYTLNESWLNSIPVGIDNLPVSPVSGYTYYDVNLVLSNTGTGSTAYFDTDTKRIYKQEKCGQYDFSNLFWLNQHGGFDSFIFNKRKYEQYDIERNMMSKILPYKYATSSTFNPSRSKTQYNSNITQTFKINTDWLNDEQCKLIKSLFLSTDVRILETIKGVDYLIPINILDSSMEVKNTRDYGLYSYEIIFQYSDRKRNQSN